MKRRPTSLLIAALLSGSVILLAGCKTTPKDEIRAQLTALEASVTKGEGFEPETSYWSIRSRGAEAVPVLIDLIADDATSAVRHIHRYRIGDLALAILLEMTGRDLEQLPQPITAPGSQDLGVIAFWAGLENPSARAAVQSDMTRWWATHQARLRWDKLSGRFVRTP